MPRVNYSGGIAPREEVDEIFQSFIHSVLPSFRPLVLSSRANVYDLLLVGGDGGGNQAVVDRGSRVVSSCRGFGNLDEVSAIVLSEDVRANRNKLPTTNGTTWGQSAMPPEAEWGKA